MNFAQYYKEQIEDCERETPREDLLSFIKQSFHTIDPGSEYDHNWHIELLAEHLLAVERGEIKRLIINLPPRYLKSVCVSVAFPAWVLGNDPTQRIVVASYNQSISLKHSTDTRLIMMSDWYRRLFPESRIAVGANQKSKFCTIQKGYRLATSVAGSLAGEGGNILIADDPHNPINISNATYRQKTIDWFEKVFASRLNNKQNGAIIVVMQRLHIGDLSAYLLEKDKDIVLLGSKKSWSHINLPLISNQREEFKINKKTFTRNKGELLHPLRDGEEEIKKLKAEIGSYSFASQYQQNPEDISNAILKREWFGRYNKDDLTTNKKINIVKTYCSIDAAMHSNDNANYSAITIWQEDKEGLLYISDVIRKQLTYPELKALVLELYQKYKFHTILVEDTANGVSLIQDLKMCYFTSRYSNYAYSYSNYTYQMNIVPIRPKHDKVTRVTQTISLLEAKKILLPHNDAWLEEFEEEIFTFPKAKYDDQIDSFSQFLNWKQGELLKEKSIFVPRIRSVMGDRW